MGSVDGGVGAAGVVSKGNGDCFIMPERHMSLSVGGGQAGQCYPCVLYKTVLFEPRSPDGEPRIYDDICPTLNTAQGGQRQPCIAQETFTMQRSDEYQVCNVESTQSARQYKSATDLIVKKKRKYIIRRLTHTECARLQGFPDTWGHLAPYNPDDAGFWEGVRKTHAEINGKTYKPVKDLKKWYDKLHTDSAEYKMWGNGVALPCVEYVMEGIADEKQLCREAAGEEAAGSDADSS